MRRKKKHVGFHLEDSHRDTGGGLRSHLRSTDYSIMTDRSLATKKARKTAPGAPPAGAAADAHFARPAESSASALVEAQQETISGLQRKVAELELRLAGNEEIQSSLADMAAIVENSDDAIVGKTLDGIIRSWNCS
jgi:PAS domain-containing protein